MVCCPSHSGKEKKVKEYIEMEISRLKLEITFSGSYSYGKGLSRSETEKKLAKSVTFFPGYVLIEAALVGEIPHTSRTYQM